VNVSVIGRVAPGLEQFLNRHILGIAPHPHHYPPPRDCSRLRVPHGYDVADSTGDSWTLTYEHVGSWPRRRTAIGAQGYRFARNGEFDCGWRLVDVAARFIQSRTEYQFDLLTILPPPPVFRSQWVLPWAAQRLAERLGITFAPALFVAGCPYAEHPDTARFLALPPSDLFTLSPKTDTQLRGASVLLADWRRHHGRTLRSLAQQLERKGAHVVRFTWFD
jgi:hypothetical protein